jgi:uncharacterized protein
MTESFELMSNDRNVAVGRTRPVMNEDTRFFWDAAADGWLAIQRCTECGVLRHPPGPACPHCHSMSWEASKATGRGTLYSYTVLHRPKPPGFDGPAIGIVVELEEGVRLISNIVAVDPDTLRIGEPLKVYFVAQEEGWTVPQFRRPTSA